MINYREHISINPNIRFGKPCIKNTRISIADILAWLAAGMSYEDIITDFPEIKTEHIVASLTFAANREQAIKSVISYNSI
ncbi:MAG: hypothetical protein DRJ07_14595 [Bacteroidetes bacterium]|nr:MAG: hypothetical protein DRJ07_14595 [Bacteroidota bacterium]